MVISGISSTVNISPFLALIHFPGSTCPRKSTGTCLNRAISRGLVQGKGISVHYVEKTSGAAPPFRMHSGFLTHSASVATLAEEENFYSIQLFIRPSIHPSLCILSIFAYYTF